MTTQPWTRATATMVGVLFTLAATALAAERRAFTPSTAPTPPAPINFPEAPTRAALDRGIAYLLAAYSKDKQWERQPERNGYRHDGGETGLVIWTLLELGAGLDDPRLRDDAEPLASATAWLIKREPKTTYAASMQALALSKLSLETNPAARKAAELARSYLASAMRADGGYTYSTLVKGQLAADNANSAVALEAMAALQDSGLEASPSYWLTAESYWRNRQHKDGGWSYDEAARRESSAAMTAAGVASLHLTRAFGFEAPATAPRPAPSTLPAAITREIPIANGMTYLAAEFKPAAKDYFFLYQFLRAASGQGRRWLNHQDIYASTATEIIAAQQPDGSWLSSFAEPSFTGDQHLVSTCYALRILAAGLAPVAFSKLEYNPAEAAWNARPGDVDSLTANLARSLRRPLRWQIIGSDTPPSADAAAPVLILTASADPKLDDALLARLAAFVHAGGTVLSTTDGATGGSGGGPEFSEALAARYAAKLSGSRYEMRELPVSHPLFELWAKVPNPPRVLAMSNGVRELWIHIPADFASAWQSRRPADRRLIPAHLYEYVTGKAALWPPEELPAPLTPPQRTLALARLRYEGNFDPEPAAWPRFARQAPARFATQINLQTTDIRDLDPAKTPLAHLTGTSRLALPEPDRAALKSYLDRGGLLLIDAIGGNTEPGSFASSIPELLSQILPDSKLETIPRNDLLYNGSLPDSVKLIEAHYRKFAPTARPLQVTPRLQGISRGGRWAVIFSEDDLTSGLLGTATWSIAGYAPKTAQSLARNLVLYSATSK